MQLCYCWVPPLGVSKYQRNSSLRTPWTWPNWHQTLWPLVLPTSTSRGVRGLFSGRTTWKSWKGTSRITTTRHIKQGKISLMHATRSRKQWVRIWTYSAHSYNFQIKKFFIFQTRKSFQWVLYGLIIFSSLMFLLSCWKILFIEIYFQNDYKWLVWCDRVVAYILIIIFAPKLEENWQIVKRLRHR